MLNDTASTTTGGRTLRMVLQDMRHPGYPPYVHWFADEIENALASAAQPVPAAVASPLTKLQRKAIAVCFTSDKVSVSEVQRKLSISYADAQTLCQSIVDLGLTDELELAPSLKRGAPAPHPAPVARRSDQGLMESEWELRDWALSTAAQPAVQQGEPLAWMDDGTLRVGSEATAYRVVTDATKRGMTASLAASFITPLYAHPAAPTAQPPADGALNTIAALRAQLAEAQRDSERLDWMIEQCAYVVSDPDCCDGYWLNYLRPDGIRWVQLTEYETPRAAIDAAKGEPS